jgi:hypothetical protein
MEQPTNVDYAALRQQYADKKREEQDQEEGDFIQVTLQLPEGASKELKVLPAMLLFSIHFRYCNHCSLLFDCCEYANLTLGARNCLFNSDVWDTVGNNLFRVDLHDDTPDRRRSTCCAYAMKLPCYSQHVKLEGIGILMS